MIIYDIYCMIIELFAALEVKNDFLRQWAMECSMPSQKCWRVEGILLKPCEVKGESSPKSGCKKCKNQERERNLVQRIFWRCATVPVLLRFWYTSKASRAGAEVSEGKAPMVKKRNLPNRVVEGQPKQPATTRITTNNKQGTSQHNNKEPATNNESTTDNQKQEL